MTKKEKANLVIQLLEERYPDALCSLVAATPLQLLIATRLSAQCTDARVNIVTPDLFARFPTIDDFADGNIEEVETYVKSCGFYKTKAADIVNMSKMIRDEYNGVVPDTIEELTKLPGVGRKTANLIVGDVYGKPAIVVDTHLIRISNRLGLVDSVDPFKIEMSLKKILSPLKSNDFCHRIVLFGRDVCVARKPRCENCPLSSVCKFYKKLEMRSH
ncbi:MAG: endonuclease III [Clostridiales bacterium 43-6]|nr:MAG: endonuclease III [Clostridiales bacterium 43-6]